MSMLANKDTTPESASSPVGEDTQARPNPPETPPVRPLTPLSAAIQRLWPGLLLTLILGVMAYLISLLNTSLDALALALILGIAARVLITNIMPNAPTTPGLRFGMQIFIPLGIILYGVNLDFNRLTAVPWPVMLLTLLCMFIFYVLIYWGNRLRWRIYALLGEPLSNNLVELIASGSAVCGASAIAVLSPSIDADAEDTSISLLVVTAVGLLGVMIYPILKEVLAINDNVYAIFSGATLHQTGLVRTAVASLSPDAADLALAVKSLRILMLAPIALATAILHRAPKTAAPLERSRMMDMSVLREALRRVWFLIPFIIVGLLVSFVAWSPLQGLLTALKPWATFVFALALASIGGMVDLESVIQVGPKPLLIGLAGWLGVIILFLIISAFIPL